MDKLYAQMSGPVDSEQPLTRTSERNPLPEDKVVAKHSKVTSMDLTVKNEALDLEALK